MAKTTITVLLPNLAAVISQKINAAILPSYLKKVISHSRFIPDKTGLSRSLFNYFSADDDVKNNTDLPITSLTSGTLCLRADPCYLHADRDQLLLFSDDLDLSAGESIGLIEEIQPLFDTLGASLNLSPDGQWLLQLSSIPDVSFTALDEVKGKGIQKYLPKGADQQDWVRLWNEVQMQLYASDINQQRVDQGKLPINSVWFWGAGTLNAKEHAWTEVQGKSSLLELLANKTNTPIKKDRAMTDLSGQYLWLMDEVDLEQDWLKKLNDLDESTLQPLWNRCKRANVNIINLHIPEHGIYQLHTRDCWKFWKRS